MIIRGISRRHGRRRLASPTAGLVLLRQFTINPKTTPYPMASLSDFGLPVNPKSADSDSKNVESQGFQDIASLKLLGIRKKHRNKLQASGNLAYNSGTAHVGRSWSHPHELGDREITPAEQWAEFQRTRQVTGSLGSSLQRRYVPHALVLNPPGPEHVTLELLMASQTHMGHKTSLWNPANARYIYGVRQGIHIISLEVTAAHLRRAARVVENVAFAGGLILFVGTRRGQMEIVWRAAEKAGACHLFTKWMPGCITNRDQILRDKGMKVVNGQDEELKDFDMFNATARPLVPDLVVCLNPVENYTMLYECGFAGVPTIGVIDTNADPSWVTYTIPSNDDSLRAMAVIGGVLGRAGERGQKRRLEEAANGRVTWQTPPAVKRQIGKDIAAALAKRRAIMERIRSQGEDFNAEELKLLASTGDGDAKAMTEKEMVDMMAETAVRTKDKDGDDGGKDKMLNAKEMAEAVALHEENERMRKELMAILADEDRLD